VRHQTASSWGFLRLQWHYPDRQSVPLKSAVAKQIGKGKIAELGLFDLLEYAGKVRLLPKGDLDLAHKVRLAADKVLHEEPTTSSEALQVIEAARTVVSVLTRKAG
jgi:hypothetical protein